MQIYYFSRTGRSKAVAEQIASRYHTTARMIDDHRNWNGKVNYLKAGAMACSGKTSYFPLLNSRKKYKFFPIFSLTIMTGAEKISSV